MSHRAQLLNLVKEYTPSDVRERVAKARILEFVDKSPDCFLRSNLAGHITGSCWLVDPDCKEVLLTHHKKIGAWLQLGGHADGDPDILRVALREAEEESGVIGITPVCHQIFDLDIHFIPEYKNVVGHLHYDIRFALKAPQRKFDVSEESHDLAWISIAALAADPTTNESLSRMAKKWIARY